MLSVIMLSVIILSVIILSVIKLSVIMLSVIMQNVIMLSVIKLNVIIMLSVVVPCKKLQILTQVPFKTLIHFYKKLQMVSNKWTIGLSIKTLP